MQTSPRRRIVVGAVAADDVARLKSRALLMAGCEVVFVGGHQSAEQLARAAQAEDAALVVLDGGDEDVQGVRDQLDAHGLSQVGVERCEQPDAPREAEGG